MAQLNDPTNEGEAMSEHYYRVGVHGPPDPKKHPWVQARFEGGWWRLIHVPDVPGRHWADGEVWFPCEAPPPELAPEPEDQGVEVRGHRYRLVDGDRVQYLAGSGRWQPYIPVSVGQAVDVAQALGLVDQPPVPRALIDTVRRWADEEKALIETRAPTHDQFHNGTWAAYRRVLSCLEAGEFGPVEPSVEWVTDRVPNDDEYPVLWGKDGHMRTAPRRDRDWYLAKGWRWVPLSVLLDAAGLGER